MTHHDYIVMEKCNLFFLWSLFVVLPLRSTNEMCDTLLLQIHASPMHHLYQIREYREDSLEQSLSSFNSDTLFYRYVTEGYTALPDELYYYYHDYVSNMQPEEADFEIARMREAARRYGSKELANEAELMQVMVVDYYQDDILQKCNQIVQKIAADAHKRGDRTMKIRAMNFEFISNFRTRNYAHAFRHAPFVEEELGKLTDEQYTERREMFYHLGQAYMTFKDYERGLLFLKQALVDTTRYFFDRSNIRARMVLGDYYRTINQLDSSDHYYRSVLSSKDMIKFRPYYDYSALVNLGYNLFLRNNSEGASRYYRTAENFAREGNYHSLSTLIYIGLGEIHLGKEEFKQTKAMIDSAFAYIRKGELEDDNPAYLRLYPLMYKYYTQIGDNEQFYSYLDSASNVVRRLEEKYNTLVLLRAGQETAVYKEITNQTRIRSQQRMLVVAAGGGLLLATGLITLGLLYRQKQKAYRKLVSRSREWARAAPQPVRNSSLFDPIDMELMTRIYQLMAEEHLYRRSELTLDMLAERVNVHRNILSKAINAVHKKNFNQFVNEYRLKDAIERLSDTERNPIVYDVAFSSGFNSIQTFYRFFKTEMGFSPSVFRKNMDKECFDTRK